MESKRCPHCGRTMKKRDYGFFHCGCGTSWVAGKGFFTRTSDMECTFEEEEIDGEIVRVPVIRYHQKKAPGEKAEAERIERFGRDPNRVTAPNKRNAFDLIRGGIYYVRKHHSEGHEMHSGRPAVVVSDVSEGDHGKVVTVVYLTSRDKHYSRTRTLVTSSGIVATAMAEQITTVDVERVGSFLGLCTFEEMVAIKKCIRSHLGLNAPDSDKIDSSAKDDYTRQLEAQNRALQTQLREQQSIIRDLEQRLKTSDK